MCLDRLLTGRFSVFGKVPGSLILDVAFGSGEM